MGDLLNRSAPPSPPHPPAGPLMVHGLRYTNSAAKFWRGIIDEVVESYPAADGFELIVPSAARLDRDYLYPQIAFEKDLERLMLTADLNEELHKTMAELEIMGPPVPVRIRVLAQDQELHASLLPLDCIDADIFPYLQVWLLEWAGIRPDDWNAERLQGDFTAEDRRTRQGYRIAFDSLNTHLSEGLYRRNLTVRYSRFELPLADTGATNTTAP